MMRSSSRLSVILVGAWGAVEWMRREGVRIDVISGPATDNEVGVRYISRELMVPSISSARASSPSSSASS